MLYSIDSDFMYQVTYGMCPAHKVQEHIPKDKVLNMGIKDLDHCDDISVYKQRLPVSN